MKKILSILAIFMMAMVSANAMGYDQAREEALFLSDKMAYELDLTEEQYEAVYEVNFDYLLRVETSDDCFGEYWRQRDLDMSYILFDWQYERYRSLEYFYRPIYWDNSSWFFRVFVPYPDHDIFYFGRPAIYFHYEGGHCWHKNGGKSWYHGRQFGDGTKGHGMRSYWDHGGYRNMEKGWSSGDGNHNARAHQGGKSTSKSSSSSSTKSRSTSRSSSSYRSSSSRSSSSYRSSSSRSSSRSSSSSRSYSRSSSSSRSYSNGSNHSGGGKSHGGGSHGGGGRR